VATVLVIEDDPPTRKAIRAIIEDRGHEVWEASNGEEGIMLCRLLLPELVVTDIMMPVQGGIETMVDLNAIFSGAKVIAMSGHADKLELALRLGARNVFLKPLSLGALDEAVTAVLQT
jgi:CheY-like chemotaxis protein